MSKAQLDHIIILVPYSVLKSPPSTLSSLFHLSPNGRHADNKTENRLVVLRDGVYLEFIAFIDDSEDRKREHWWGDLRNGIIDFALTSRAVGDLTDPGGAQDRLEKLKDGLSVTYQKPRAGSRIRWDEKEVKWLVTFPTGRADAVEAVRRGSVPFWCHDVTDRELRVPAHDAEATEHPSAAVGVRQLEVGVPKGKLEEFVATYSAILGEDGLRQGDDTYKFVVGTPFGGEDSCAVVLRSFGEDNPRILKLVLRADSKRDASGIREALGGGNDIDIEVVPDV